MNWIDQISSLPKWKVYSQCYEETYIDHILKNIPSIDKTILELGAWDGFHLSNTRYFIEKSYKALLVDGDNHGNEEVHKLFITKDNILPFLKENKLPIKFDFFNIDLDGNDIYIIDEILKDFRPSLIVAEFNPIFSREQSVAIKYDPNHTWSNDNYYGFSFGAGMKMAIKNGYTCIFQNDNLNMYFVENNILSDSLGVTIDQIPFHIPQVNHIVAHYHPISTKNDWQEY